MIEIRSEQENDIEVVRQLTIDAFTNSKFGYHGEAELVDELRANCKRCLSLVAVDDGVIVGHILFTPARIGWENAAEGMGLAPMSVAPDHQSKGVGTKLIQAGLANLKESQCPFVIVLGHPEYYPRFGFEPGAKYEITHGFEGIAQEAFFVKFVDPEDVPSFEDSRAYYRPEFGVQHAN